MGIYMSVICTIAAMGLFALVYMIGVAYRSIRDGQSEQAYAIHGLTDVVKALCGDKERAS